MKPVPFTALYGLVALAPGAIAYFERLPPRSILDELATGLGLTALAILLLEFLLSGRFRVVSRNVGLDVTMRAHQLLARLAVVFIILHPFLYVTPMMNPARPDDPTRQFALGVTGPTLMTGLLAWLLALTLIISAIFRDQIGYRYETWRRAHGLGALVVVMLSVHHAIEAGRYSGRPALMTFWLIMLGLAVLSIIWVYVLRPIQQFRRPWSVERVTRIAEKTWELAIVPVGGHRLDYQAGQFAWVNIGHNPFSLHENPFSISSAPAQGATLTFIIKELGDFTRQIGAVKPGTRVYLDGSHGNLSLKGSKSAGIALIAGGVGIAPLIGILRQLAVEGDKRPVILVYGNRVEAQIVHAEELEALKSRLDLRVVHVLSEPAPGWRGQSGRIDVACLSKIFSFEHASDWLYLLCGPPPMLTSAETALRGLGVHTSNILSERFGYD